MGTSLSDELSFYCYYENERFPISELGKDSEGNLVHNRPPAHFPSGDAPDGPVLPLPLNARAEVMGTAIWIIEEDDTIGILKMYPE